MKAVVSYRSGSWVAVAATHTWLLVDLPPDHDMVQRSWALLSAGGGADDLLDTLASLGVAAAPAFALLDLAAGRYRVAVRGGSEVVIEAVGEERVITAPEGASWFDGLLDGPVKVITLRNTAEGTPAVELPMGSGVTMASGVLIRPGDDAAPEARQPGEDIGVVSPEEASRDAPARPADDPTQAGASESDRAEPKGADEAKDPDSAATSYDYLFGATQRPPAVADDPAGPAAGSAEGGPDRAQDPATQSTGPGGQPDWAQTAGWNTQAASLTPGDDELAADDGPPTQAPAAPPPPPAPPAGGLIDSLPWASTPPPPAADAPRWAPPPLVALTGPAVSSPSVTSPAPATQSPEEAGHTVDRSAVRAALEAEPPVTGPTVLAGHCPSGHLSPPHAPVCRVCGVAMPQQDPFEIARPPLGVLRLSTGDSVTLDRDVLLGRAPSESGDGHERPHLVKLTSPESDVSRNHAEIVLDGWHVFVRDLGSTNGTVVTLPGRAPTRLRQNDLQLLEHGSVVTLADEISFTFEVTG